MSRQDRVGKKQHFIIFHILSVVDLQCCGRVSASNFHVLTRKSGGVTSRAFGRIVRFLDGRALVFCGLRIIRRKWFVFFLIRSIINYTCLHEFKNEFTNTRGKRPHFLTSKKKKHKKRLNWNESYIRQKMKRWDQRTYVRIKIHIICQTSRSWNRNRGDSIQ